MLDKYTTVAQTAITTIENIQSIVDSTFWYDTLHKELDNLKQALEEVNPEAIENAIAYSVDGCATPSSQLYNLGRLGGELETLTRKLQELQKTHVQEKEARLYA